MTFEDMLEAIKTSPIPEWVRSSEGAFPWIESTHVLAVTVVVGTILIIDLRLIGYRAHRRGARQLMVDLLPLTWAAFGLAVVTGTLLFTSHADIYARNPFFLSKVGVLVAAGLNMGLFHLTSFQRIEEWNLSLPPPRAARLSGIASLLLWLVVVCLGRLVGFTLSE